MTGLNTIRAVTRLSIAISSGDEGSIARHGASAVAAIGSRAVYELALQSLLFCGFPKAINALAILRMISGKKFVEGAVNNAIMRQRGKRVCKTIYGSDFEKMLVNMKTLHPDIAWWIIDDGYGRILARPACPLVLREVSVVSILAVTRCYRQLRPHLKGLVSIHEDSRAKGNSHTPTRALLNALCTAILPFAEKSERKTVRSFFRVDDGNQNRSDNSGSKEGRHHEGRS